MEFPTKLAEMSGQVRDEAKKCTGLERMRLNALADTLRAEMRCQQQKPPK